ncbi:MAG: ABC transporter substrate-binding protein, partial [Defluviitaleaceae bacterium]|nr:ABC transporter substrate-binding protein [Defluviitaleaceae bacterium]
RTIFIDDYQASAMAYFARNSLDAQTALVVVSDIDGSFNHIAEVFATEFQALGGQTEMFPIAGSFARIFERYRDDPPDIVYFPANFDAAAEMINAAHAADLSDMHILGSDAWDGLLTYIVEPGAMRNVYYTSAFSFDDPDPAITQFVRRFLSYFSQMPLTASATAYTCVFILAEAIEKAGGTNADDIVSAMRTLEFDTIIGRIRFDENNNPRTSVYVIQIKDGVYSMYKKISAQETGGEWD